MPGRKLTLERLGDGSIEVTASSATLTGDKIEIIYNEDANATVTRKLVRAADRVFSRLQSSYGSGGQPQTLGPSTSFAGPIKV